MKPAHVVLPEERLVRVASAAQQTIATAESCTGGMIAQRITAIPGASAIFTGGIVSYANSAKQRLLDVNQVLLQKYGAVSSQCAAAMAEGARRKLGADWAIAVTGIAGPDGGTQEKPVGLVYFAVASTVGIHTAQKQFSGDRNSVRVQAAEYALLLALKVFLKNRQD